MVISYSRGLLDYCERRRKLLLMVGTGQEWSWECDCLSTHREERLSRLLSLAASHSLGSLSVGHISADKRPDRGDCNHSVWVYDLFIQIAAVKWLPDVNCIVTILLSKSTIVGSVVSCEGLIRRSRKPSQCWGWHASFISRFQLQVINNR